MIFFKNLTMPNHWLIMSLDVEVFFLFFFPTSSSELHRGLSSVPHANFFLLPLFLSQHVKQRSQTGSGRSRDRICPRQAHSYHRQRPFVSVGMRPHTHIKVGMMSPALIVPLQCGNYCGPGRFRR